MPTGYVKKLAEKHGTSTKTAENKWNKAKDAANKGDADDNWALTTHIFKNMMGEKSSVSILGSIYNSAVIRLRLG